MAGVDASGTPARTGIRTAATRRTACCARAPWTDGCELSLATGDEARRDETDAVHARLLPGVKGEGRKQGMDGAAVQTEDRSLV